MLKSVGIAAHGFGIRIYKYLVVSSLENFSISSVLSPVT